MIADFRDLLVAFVTNRVRFLVVGAHALAAHGIPRTTGDLDVWVEPTRANAVRVWKAMSEFGAPLADLDVHESDFAAPDRVVQLGLPPYRVDILTAVSGLTFEDAWADRLPGHLFGVDVPFLGRDTMIRNKRATGRDKDLEDVRALEG